MSDDLKNWTIDSSKYLVDDRFLRLRLDSCTTPKGGKVEKYYIFEYGDWANCLVIDTNNDVIMLKHYRHGVQRYIPEFVSGGIETGDPSPKAGIRRELEEEIGYTGGEIYQIGVCYPNPASHTNKVYSFIALGGSCTKEPTPEVGESLVIERIPLKTLMKDMGSLDSDAIYQSMHITTIFFAINFIKHSSLDSMRVLKGLID